MRDDINYPKIVSKMTPLEFKAEDICAQPDFDIVQDIGQYISEALVEANKQNIKANTIAINDKLLFSRLTTEFFDIPMVMGLKCVCDTSELPDDVLFSVFYADNPPETIKEQCERLKRENAELKNRLNEIVEFIEGI